MTARLLLGALATLAVTIVLALLGALHVDDPLVDVGDPDDLIPGGWTA